MPQERVIETDVLVIGGGMAGLNAALKARERGVDVTLVDKGYVGKSGASHQAEGDLVYFRPERGHKVDEFLACVSRESEYINNPEWCEICLRESGERYDDLVSWGVPFYHEHGSLYTFKLSWDAEHETPYENITMMHGKYLPILREAAVANGVRILDRLMLCQLLKRDGEAAGAVGFHTTSGDLYVIKAGAVVVATGASGLKQNTNVVHFWTGDGEIMAYNAGAEVTGKEFLEGWVYVRTDVERLRREPGAGHVVDEANRAHARYPFAINSGYTDWYDYPMLNAEGEAVIFPPWDAHLGKAPLYNDLDNWFTPQIREWLDVFFERIGTQQQDKVGLDLREGGKLEWPSSRLFRNHIAGGTGVWPAGTDCSTAVPGLYAAGNTLATMVSGAQYGGMGWALNHAAVTGARAGVSAAARAAAVKSRAVDGAHVTAAKAAVCAPLERQGGFSPAWATQLLHSLTSPYYVFDVKHPDRLEPTLALVEFLRGHIAPKVFARDPHQLRMAHEAKNIMLVAEMSLRASLFRTESRGHHFREDYPRRDDPAWLAWVKIKDEDGRMTLTKEQISEKWWPDLTRPYEERYPNVLPLEDATSRLGAEEAN